MKFRKKPVVVDAWVVEDVIADYTIDSRIEDAVDQRVITLGTSSIVVNTLEGVHVATEMLVCGVRGEFYGCDYDIFLETYMAEFSDE